jgi:anti-sigma regulatory factor (Ser/Thr protein kinase)
LGKVSIMSAESTTVGAVSPAKADFALTLGIKSRLDQIRLVRAAIGGVLSHLDVAGPDIDALGLAVTEILNNAMEHGYQGDEQQDIEVRMYIHPSEVEIDIVDNARPFPEAERYRLNGDLVLPEDPSEDWAMRGHGLQIVRQLVDSIQLEFVDGRNCMKLKKRVTIQPPPATDLAG